MSPTIDSLNIQITTSASQAEQKINALANALGNLKSSSKITTAVNGLNKLAGALNTLNPALAGLNTAKLNSLRGTLIGLGNVSKLSGLNSAINTLKKLPEVISSLDEAALTSFTAQMKRLAKALEPLVTKINAVGAAFAALPSHLRQAVTAVDNMGGAIDELGNDLDAGGLNLMTFTSNLETFLGYAQRVIQAFSDMIDAAVSWDGIQARFGRAMGDSAEKYYEHILMLNEVMGLNVQQFMGDSSLYADMMRGFGVAADDAATMAIGFTELVYDIWAGTSDVFKSYEEAADAVRSTIGGETESIQRAGFSVIESTLQETAARHDLAINIEKATMAEKTYLRYLTLVDQAHARGYVGVYAAEMRTAEGALRDLAQQTKTLSQAIGSLFIPALTAVIPYVTAFVELITDAVRWVAQLFGINMFSIDWGRATSGASELASGVGDVAAGAGAATSGLEDAAGAAKKLKDYTMGFDELNVIEPPKETGGAGGGGGAGGVGGGNLFEGMDLDTLWDESVFAQATKQVDELKEKMRDFFTDWKTWAVVAGVAMGALALSWGKIKAAYEASKFAAMVAAVSNFTRSLYGAATGSAAAQSAFALMYPKLTAIVGWFKTAWAAVAAFVGGLTTGAILTIVGIITAIASVVYFLYENWEQVVQAVKDFFATNIVPKLEGIKESWEKIKTALADVRDAFLDAIPPGLKDMLEDLGDWIGNIVDKIKDWFKSIDWLEAIGKVFETIGGIIFGVVSGVIAGAISTFVGMLENLVQIFSGVVQYIAGFIELIVKLFSGDLDGARKACQKIIDGIVDLWKGLWGLVFNPIKNFVQGVIDWFVELWDELVGHSVVPDMINAIVDWFLSLPKKILTPIQNFANDVIKKFKDMWSGVQGWYRTNVAPKFTKEYWKTTFDTIVTGLKTKLDEAWKKVTDFFSVEEWKKKVVAAIGAIKDNFKIPELPKIALSVTWDTNVGAVKKAVYEALGLSGWPRLSWTTYAGGGFPDMGEMFIAREAGPELVGKIGNRSTVANNDQIVQAVSQGVYSAVRAAMSGDGNNNNQNVNVYIDGKQIYASVKKTERERGLSLMGGQLGYAY